MALAGALFLLAAALVSNNALERALLSDATRSLSWGPTLFRLLLAGHGLALVLVALRLMKTSAATKLVAKSSATQHEASWYPWLVLTVLSLIALGLRLWRLNTDLWFDELLTLLNFVRMPVGDIISRLPDQNNHILFSLLSHFSVRLFGESAWALRLPSVLFGVMSLWALFLLGRRVLGTREALAACALMTFSYHHIWFSQNARGYMALLFFSLLTTWIWLEGVRRQSWGWWIAYSLAVAGGMWAHLTLAFVVSAHALLYLITISLSTRKNRRQEGFGWRPIAAFTLCATLTLQLYALALPEFLSVGLHEVSLESEWTNPWWVITETLRNLQIGFSGFVVVLGAGLMVGLGWWNMMRREWQPGILMVLPPVLAGSTMLALGHNLWPRFFFFSMGFALLIVVHGAMTVPRLVGRYLATWPQAERLSIGAGYVLACLMILASAVTVPRNYAHPKQDYTGARDYVESLRGPNDVVVAVGLAGIAYRSYFAPTWSVAQTHAELDSVRRGKANVWLIYTLPVEVKAYRPDVWQEIQSDFAVVKIFPGTLGGGEVVVCRQLANGKGQLAHLAKGF
jgi:mannosyltransferase